MVREEQRKRDRRVSFSVLIHIHASLVLYTHSDQFSI